MLDWQQVPEFRAVSRCGTYRVFPNWDKRGLPVVAVLSFFDLDGRLYEHTVGMFPTLEAAKAACETDSKTVEG